MSLPEELVKIERDNKTVKIYKWFGYLCLGVTTNGRDMTSINLDDDIIEMIGSVLHDYKLKNK